MKTLMTLLLILLVSITASCSKKEDQNSNVDESIQTSFSEKDVVDIVNAIGDNDIDGANSLLQANPNLIKATYTYGGPYGGWPLLMIAVKTRDKSIIELLLSKGADVNAQNLSNEVALHYAAASGDKDMVQILIDHKADVNLENDAGATPLSIAAGSGYNEIVTLLKQYGAR